MTPASPESAPDCEGDDPIARRCLQYLLGELSESEAARMESDLTTSPTVNRELLVQAEISCVLAAAQQAGVHESAGQLPSLSPMPSLDSLPATGFSARSRRWARMVAAVAACLAVVIAGWLWQRQSDLDAARLEASHRAAAGDEALLIARAWATSHVSLGSIEDGSIEEGEIDWVDDAPANDDSFLAWMVVAVAADAEVESTAPGATSEG